MWDIKLTDYKAELTSLHQLLSQNYFPYQKGAINLVDAVAGRYEDILLSFRKTNSKIARSTALQWHAVEHINKLIANSRNPRTKSQGVEDFTEVIRILRLDIEELISLASADESNSTDG